MSIINSIYFNRPKNESDMTRGELDYHRNKAYYRKDYIKRRDKGMTDQHDITNENGAMEISITQTDPQKIFTLNESKFRAYVGGVGCGKTASGWHNALKSAFQNPGSLGVIVAPTYPLIRDVILRERVRWIPDELVLDYNKTDKEMTFINGSTILFRSAKDEAQIERLRGLSIAWGWIDEATLLPKLVLDILTARLRQPGQREYKLWMTCTPRKGWLYDMIQDGLSDEWFVLDNIESSSNTFLPNGYTDSLKELYTGQFYDQEVLGQWVDFEGLIWKAKILDGEAPSKFSPQTWYGVDVGWEHPTAIIAVKELNGIYHVVDEYYESHTHDEDIISEVKRMREVWGDGRRYVDPSVPRTIYKLNSEKLNANPAKNKVMDGLRVVRALFDTGKLFIHPRCVNLIKEIEGYSWRDGGKEEPEKINDDACDALRYAIMAATGKTMHKSPGIVRGKRG